MSKMTREEKLFKNEIKTLNDYRELAETEHSPEDTKEALRKLTNKYKTLLEQTRFLTWISGRLERKLHRTNRELFQKNIHLENTLNDLTRAEASKNASAIIYFIAIVLFVLEEYFVEPFILVFGDNVGWGIGIKLAIVLLLKVSEGFIERKISQRRIRQSQKEAAITLGLNDQK
jgi:hypothetical protein